MPNLEEIRRKEELERQAKAEQAAAYVYRPPQETRRQKRGPTSPEGTWQQHS